MLCIFFKRFLCNARQKFPECKNRAQAIFCTLPDFTLQKIAGTTHNAFVIQTGVAVIFPIKKSGGK